MGAVAFDTLEFVEALKNAGVPEKQAKAFSTVVQKSQKDAGADMATKQDILELRQEMRHEMSGLRYEMNDLRKDMDAKHDSLHTDVRHQIKELELRLTIKLGTIIVATASVLPLLFKFLHLT